MLKFKIILNIDPAMICIWLNPKSGFKVFPKNKSMQQAMDECNEDKTLKPKILFCGRLRLRFNFMESL